MSTYQQRYQQLTDLHAAADPLLGTDRERWRDARRAAALAVLLDAAGEPGRDGVPSTAAVLLDAALLDQSERGTQLVADLLDRLDAHLRDPVVWLAETGDTDVVAGVAALLDRARQSAGSTPSPS